MTQDKIQEALKDFNHNLQLKKGHPYDFCIVRLLPSSVETIRQALQSQLSSNPLQPHTCTASGFECVGNFCEPARKPIDIEVELDDEEIIAIALYASKNDIKIKEALAHFVESGIAVDELPPVNEATGHDTV